MKVILLNKFYGYCPGLERSLKIADGLFARAQKKNKKIYFDVPLAHNEIVKKNLEDKGFRQIQLDDKTAGDKNLFLISAHGASSEKIAWLQSRGFIVKSATCPKVSRLQELAAESRDQGYAIIIFGNKDHPEIIGVNGCINHSAVILKTAEEAEKIKIKQPTVVLCQTTFPLKKFHEIIAILKKNNPNIELIIKQTICPIVEGRVFKICDFAKKEKPDINVVVGSTWSNNTKLLHAKLAEIAATVMVGNETELKPADFMGKDKVLVAAGTSTPPEAVERVAEKLRSMG